MLKRLAWRFSKIDVSIWNVWREWVSCCKLWHVLVNILKAMTGTLQSVSSKAKEYFILHFIFRRVIGYVKEPHWWKHDRSSVLLFIIFGDKLQQSWPNSLSPIEFRLPNTWGGPHPKCTIQTIKHYLCLACSGIWAKQPERVVLEWNNNSK